MPRETPTYYPGDRTALQVDIEHRVNFRRVWAAFYASVEGPGTAPEKHSKVLTTDEVAVQKTRPDGTKTSMLYFEGRADSESLLAGEDGDGRRVARRGRDEKCPGLSGQTWQVPAQR